MILKGEIMTTDYARRVAAAVNDEDWQRFRKTLKGKPTEAKLDELCEYWYHSEHSTVTVTCAQKYCDVCIRIDNYIKALARGGQLFAGESLETVMKADWRPRIKK